MVTLIGLAVGVYVVGWWLTRAYQTESWGMFIAGVLLAFPAIKGMHRAGYEVGYWLARVMLTFTHLARGKRG